MDTPKPFKIKLIASPEDFEPTRKDFRVVGAFNPGVATVETANGLETVLFVRVAETPKRRICGKVLLPFFHIKNQECAPLEIDYDITDRKGLKKVYKKHVVPKQGPTRLRHISLPRMVLLNEDGEISEMRQEPAISPCWEFERFGLEDVRITYIRKKGYFVTYVTPHRDSGVCTSLLKTRDIKNPLSLERVIRGDTPHPGSQGKDGALFSEKIASPAGTEIIRKGQKLYAALVRPDAHPDVSRPGVGVSFSPDLVHWGQSHRLITSEGDEVTGTGSPPVKRPYGWLAAYHETTRNKKGKTNYGTKFMVLDLKKPWIVLYKTPTLLEREDFRKILPENGYVPNTVFTTGMVVDEKRGIITLYHGIDDKWTALTSYYTKDIDKFARAA